MNDTGELWLDALGCDALYEGDVTSVNVVGSNLAIYDAVDGSYATQARCSRAGADLCDGYFDGHTIECPLHQRCFDIRSGEPRDAPVTARIAPTQCAGSATSSRSGWIMLEHAHRIREQHGIVAISRTSAMQPSHA